MSPIARPSLVLLALTLALHPSHAFGAREPGPLAQAHQTPSRTPGGAPAPGERPEMTPDATRNLTAAALEKLLTTGGADRAFFDRLFELAPVRAYRPSADARADMASALTDAVAGRTFDAGRAAPVAKGIAFATVAHGASLTDLRTSRDGMLSALAASGATAEQNARLFTAFDRIIAGQIHPGGANLAEALSEIKRGETPSAEQSKSVAALVMALCAPGARPSAPAVDALATQLVGAAAERGLELLAATCLSREITTAFHDAAADKAKALQAIDNARAVLLASGVELARADAVAAACRSVHAGMNAGAP